MYEKLKKCIGKPVELHVYMDGLSGKLVGQMRRVSKDFYLVEEGHAALGFHYKKMRSIEVLERPEPLPVLIRVR